MSELVPPVAPVAPTVPNESTRRTLSTLKQFIDEQYPLVAPDASPPFKALFNANLDTNQKVHAAFERYREAVSRPNPVYAYITEHLEEGFSRDEIKIFVTGLGLRVLPTTSVLGDQDALLREVEIHDPDYIGKNHAAEGGGGGEDSHIKLFYDHFVANVTRAFGFDSRQFHPLTLEAARQIASYHKQYGELTTKPGNTKLDALLEFFISKGILNAASFNMAAKDLPHKPVTDGWVLPLKADQTPVDASFMGVYAFREGENLARIIPDSLREYGKQSKRNQRQLTQQDEASDLEKSDLIEVQLKSYLSLLTREGNADQFSHIHGAKKFADRWCGGSKWADEHVDEHVGVEEDHANKARDLFMTTLRAGFKAPDRLHGVVSERVAGELIDAFDYVVDKDYCKLQQNHMNVMVEAMQKARKAALDVAKETGEDPLIKPPVGERAGDTSVASGPAQQRVAAQRQNLGRQGLTL